MLVDVLPSISSVVSIGDSFCFEYSLSFSQNTHISAHTSRDIQFLYSQIIISSIISIQDKKLKLSLNGNRKVTGQLRGYDAFLNVVLEDAVSETMGGAAENIGTVVIRGNSIIQFESVDRI